MIMKKKFDLQKALDGHPLVTRDGRKVLHFSSNGNTASMYPYVAFIDESTPKTFTEKGRFIRDKKSNLDLFLEV